MSIARGPMISALLHLRLKAAQANSKAVSSYLGRTKKYDVDSVKVEKDLDTTYARLAKSTSLVHRISLHPLYIGTIERLKHQITTTSQL